MEFSCVSNTGNRDQNEDSARGIILEESDGNRGFFVLADGLGGHGRGEVASQYVTEAFLDYFRNHFTDADVLEKGIEYVQEGLLQIQKIENAKNEMKTTIVALCIQNGCIRWGHVGDSRLYYFKKKKLVCRSLDHSVPQMLALAGEIKEKDIRKHPDRNKLLRVLGTEWEEPQYEISDEWEQTGQEAFLLCSDGFWENITEKEMVKALKKAKNVNQWINIMNEIVQKHGMSTDMDNNTALAIMT
ncbi:MAG: protein phosphatase 2C domain-containing protein [Acetatifactor sp.]|nr:protein phosphatase 2C domain-containing protein [Acetatifactor sp.]